MGIKNLFVKLKSFFKSNKRIAKPLFMVMSCFLISVLFTINSDIIKNKNIKATNTNTEVKLDINNSNEIVKYKTIEFKSINNIDVNDIKSKIKQRIGENNDVLNLSIENGNINVTINLYEVDKEYLDELMVSIYGAIADLFSNVNDWITLTVDYKTKGKISMNVKDAIYSEHYGKYFKTSDLENQIDIYN